MYAITWLQTWTAVWLVTVVIGLFLFGLALRLLVERSQLHPTRAVRIIEAISVIVGGGVGSVVMLLLIIILWPSAGNWLINNFLPETLIWQTQFQQWLTQKITDPITSTAIGLLIQRIQFGSAFLGFLGGWLAKWIIERLMVKSSHLRAA